MERMLKSYRSDKLKIISGPTGRGKTRLVKKWIEDASRESEKVILVVGTRLDYPIEFTNQHGVVLVDVLGGFSKKLRHLTREIKNVFDNDFTVTSVVIESDCGLCTGITLAIDTIIHYNVDVILLSQETIDELSEMVHIEISWEECAMEKILESTLQR